MKRQFTLKNYNEIIENKASILALDYGEKKSGLSIFNPSEDFSPYPLMTIKTPPSYDKFFAQLELIIKENQINAIVMGIPYLTDGKETPQTKKLMKIFNKLSNDITYVDFFTQDETLSSFEAEQRMESSPRYNFRVDQSKIDEIAATIILEDFIKNIKK